MSASNLEPIGAPCSIYSTHPLRIEVLRDGEWIAVSWWTEAEIEHAFEALHDLVEIADAHMTEVRLIRVRFEVLEQSRSAGKFKAVNDPSSATADTKP